MNDDVKQFRWREALKTLADTSKALKEYNPALEITCCVHATMNTYYVTEQRGYDNWEDYRQIARTVDLYERLGVDRLGTWTYRGGYGTTVAAPEPMKLWDAIGASYNRVLKR